MKKRSWVAFFVKNDYQPAVRLPPSYGCGRRASAPITPVRYTSASAHIRSSESAGPDSRIYNPLTFCEPISTTGNATLVSVKKMYGQISVRFLLLPAFVSILSASQLTVLHSFGVGGRDGNDLYGGLV